MKSAHQYHQTQIYLESLLMRLILTDGQHTDQNVSHLFWCCNNILRPWFFPVLTEAPPDPNPTGFWQKSMLYFLKIPAACVASVASVPFCFPSDQGLILWQRFLFQLQRSHWTHQLTNCKSWSFLFYSLYNLQEILQYIEWILSWKFYFYIYFLK